MIVFRQLFPQSLLDYPAARKGHSRFWLGNYNVSQHGKTGGDAAGGRVGQNRDVKLSRFPVAFQSPGNLGHLHQAKHSFLHSRTAGSADNDHGQVFSGGVFDEAGQLFSDN